MKRNAHGLLAAAFKVMAYVVERWICHENAILKMRTEQAENRWV